MRDNILAIIDYARNAMGNNNERTEQLLSEIETEAMAALQGGKHIIPSELYFVVERDDPMDKGFAFKSLDYYLEDFNNDMGTEYRTIEQFNKREEYRHIYIIKEISE